MARHCARHKRKRMRANHEYVLGYSPAEQRRLQQQAGELADESAWLFDQIGISEGCHVVEIGCGPQGCLELLSGRVGAKGSVIGVELSGDAVELALQFLSNRGIKNVEVRQGNGSDTRLPREYFDLATSGSGKHSRAGEDCCRDGRVGEERSRRCPTRSGLERACLRSTTSCLGPAQTGSCLLLRSKWN